MAVSEPELRTALRQVRDILQRIEKKLNAEVEGEIDPYVRRRQILLRIYWRDNDMGRDELMRLLEAYGTTHTWIGQQVKKGYLTVSRIPGNFRYSATEKAIQEQDLEDEDERAEVEMLTRASAEVFAEDWDGDEDSVYDSL